MKTIKLSYRVSGQVKVVDFEGEVVLDGVPQEGWDKDLDLTKIPVILFTQKKSRYQQAAKEEFIAKNPDFKGAFYCTPFNRTNGFSYGTIYISSEHLTGKRISGGRPEEKILDIELRNGRLIGTRAMVLHEKIVEKLGEVEVPYSVEELASFVSNMTMKGVKRYYGTLGEHGKTLYAQLSDLIGQLSQLHRDVIGACNPPNYGDKVYEALLKFLKEKGISKLEEIPSPLPISIETVSPELWARKNETVIDIPGLGKKPITDCLWGYNIRFVEIKTEELRFITEWPFKGIGIKTLGLSNNDFKPGNKYSALIEGKNILPAIIDYIEWDLSFIPDPFYLGDKEPSYPPAETEVFVNPKTGETKRKVAHHILIKKGWFRIWTIE